MIFKKLELTGFKSFLEKTALYFEPGITAIVGPNGCGKSNIIDSIKWVLGEQSAKSLRGSKMEDVIFSGTDEKEPINMAEVSLILSNKDKILPIDADEVVVSRRIFRLGESEYLINKTPVRLREVTELFMGTGIGAEMYSIIEQGKVDLIISSRPEERRFIFEEASGITKYKSRKKEAVRKLEATDNNLLRVNDIITEVKRQIDSITRQARKAERYKERFDRLKELEIRLASYEYDLLSKEKEEIETSATKVRDEVNSLSSELERLRHQLYRQKASFAEIDKKFSELQNSKFSKESQIEQNRNRIDMNKERLIELSARVEDLREELKTLEIRKESSQKLIQELQGRLQAVLDLEEAKKDFLNEKEKHLERLELEISENEKRIEESKEKLVDYMAERSKSRNEVVRLTSDIQNRSSRLRRLDLELEKVTGEVVLVKKKLDEIKREFKGVESRLNNTCLEQGRLETDKESVSSSVDSLEKKLHEKKGMLITLESKKSFLEDLIAHNEGFAAGVKAILDSMKRDELQIDGIKGVLGNKIEVKKGYEFAVEAALGDNVQCIISQDIESALKAAEYLNINKLGRATFIILDELKTTRESEDKLLKIDGISARLADFVDVEDELKDAITNLLKGIYLVETIENIDKIFNAVPPDARENIRLVTKNGEVFSKGFITAGATIKGEDAGIIGREMRLKETIKEIELSRIEINEMEREVDVLKSSLSEFIKKINNIDEILKEIELEYHNKESELSSIERENKRLEEEISLLKLEKNEVTEEIKELTNTKDELEEKLKEIESWENNTQDTLLNSQGMVKNFSKEREDVVVLIAEIKTETQALSKEKTDLSQSLKLQREMYDAYVRSIDQKANEIDLSNKKSDELSQEVEEMETEITNLSGGLETARKELIQIDTDKNKNTAIIEDIEKCLNELYKASNEKKDAEHSFEMKKSELGFKIDTLKNRMAQLYKVNMDVDRCEVDPSSDWDVIRREIEGLNRKLESMGPVNLVAIEEHKELEDRYNFLCQQRQDLLDAKEDLQKVIAKINKTTRKLFIETFEKIQFEFKNYFRYLFGGGQAEIYLLDENDVLESGIEIVARPPGRRLQNITLLSGGEKALTAIALIFAIFKVKPSPFCLLDEIDAPLDESNIDRFCKALREFTKRSQFIVITHNKGTITLADVMYGITMEKSGISKIVSVKFHDEARGKSIISEEKKGEEEKVLTS